MVSTKYQQQNNSKITVETARIKNYLLTSQISRKLNKIKMDSNTQILQVTDSTKAEKFFFQLQNSLGSLEKGLNAKMVLLSAD